MKIAIQNVLLLEVRALPFWIAGNMRGIKEIRIDEKGPSGAADGQLHSIIS